MESSSVSHAAAGKARAVDLATFAALEDIRHEMTAFAAPMRKWRAVRGAGGAIEGCGIAMLRGALHAADHPASLI
ncbi:hypothetical protein [Gemmobacter lutimaris]|uniref:hypothetical protein n=1 Tax=Gemmobacter lutimaris TaxID=2306023 RepID=UPI0018F3BAF2|nr:hypothetical protein [Gemmobacter lutimaris]